MSKSKVVTEDYLNTVLDDRFEKFEKKFEGKMDQKFERIEDRILAQMDKWRSDFYDKIDPILQEVVIAREERAVMNNQISDLRKDVDGLKVQYTAS